MSWRDLSLGMLGTLIALLWKTNKRRISVIALTATALYVTKRSWNKRQKGKRGLNLEKLRQKRRAERDSKCETLLQTELYTKEKDDITKMTYTELKDAIEKYKLTAVEVLEAYLMKAALVHKKTNCLVDIIQEAKRQSLEIDNNEDRKKLLFGIPISVKENYNIKNYQSNMGCSYYLDKIPDDDSAIVKILKHHGAIPFVKTNVPQTLMSGETTNLIYGQTTHPLNNKRTCGGSTGGEAALISAGGSLLGYGTDIAGSIRLPAHFCGITGIKPTVQRCSKKGVRALVSGQTCVSGSTGPLARDIDTLVMGFRVLVDPFANQVDHQQPIIPFNDQIYSSEKKLKIGYYTYDGAFHCSRSCQRAVEEAVAILKHQGHQVQKWDFKDYGRQGYTLAKKAFNADKGQSAKKILKNDAIDPNILFVPYKPHLSYDKAAALHKHNHPQSFIHNLISAKQGLRDVTSYYQLVDEIKQFQDKVTNDWRSNRFDAVLCPVFPSVATRLGDMKFAEGSASYLIVYNTLNYPAGVVPITTVTMEDLEQSYPVIDSSHQQIKDSLAGTEGLPVGIQVVTLTWQEELCLRVMKELEKGVSSKNTGQKC